MGRLDGKVAIVTGAGQGVGRGIALALASEGVAVAVAGRTLAKVEKVAAEIAERGGRAIALPCDVRDPVQVTSCVADAIVQLGRLDILVNNAQEATLGTVLEVTDEAVAAGWESGPLATLRFMKAAYPHLKGGGVIINLGSSASVNPNAVSRGVYGAIKSAVLGFTRAAAIEWGPDGIRAVALMPRAMTPSVEHFAETYPEEYARGLQAVPMRREGDAEHDVGRTVVFLCSDDASFITGTTIPIDGGQAYLR